VIKRAKVEMTGENSPQKSFSGQMKASFALHNSFAHIGPSQADLADREKSFVRKSSAFGYSLDGNKAAKTLQ